jgi:hypothetical protein
VICRASSTARSLIIECARQSGGAAEYPEPARSCPAQYQAATKDADDHRNPRPVRTGLRSRPMCRQGGFLRPGRFPYTSHTETLPQNTRSGVMDEATTATSWPTISTGRRAIIQLASRGPPPAGVRYGRRAISRPYVYASPPSRRTSSIAAGSALVEPGKPWVRGCAGRIWCWCLRGWCQGGGGAWGVWASLACSRSRTSSGV